MIWYDKHNTNYEFCSMGKKRYKILIIDDDIFLLEMYSQKFKEHNFEIYTALSGQEALSQLEDGALSPDILIVDIVMPSMDGFELLKRIRDEKLCENARVLVLSNLGEQSDIEKAKQLGIDGYIVKASATPSEVVEKVIEMVEKK